MDPAVQEGVARLVSHDVDQTSGVRLQRDVVVELPALDARLAAFEPPGGRREDLDPSPEEVGPESAEETEGREREVGVELPTKETAEVAGAGGGLHR